MTRGTAEVARLDAALDMSGDDALDIVGIETAGRLRLCGGEMDRLETFDDAWLLSDNGRIAAFGSMNSLGEMAADEVVDAGGGMHGWAFVTG